MADHVLPPLPPSDSGSLARNHFDGYYKRSARDFWKDNRVETIPETPFKKCDHEFKMVVNGAQCVKCHFGLTGPIEVRDGKLYHNGEKLPL
jgi:hypothetical protein